MIQRQRNLNSNQVQSRTFIQTRTLQQTGGVRMEAVLTWKNGTMTSCQWKPLTSTSQLAYGLLALLCQMYGLPVLTPSPKWSQIACQPGPEGKQRVSTFGPIRVEHLGANGRERNRRKWIWERPIRIEINFITWLLGRLPDMAQCRCGAQTFARAAAP